MLHPVERMFHNFHMDVSKNRGTPKWMVKIMENPIKMDDLGGNPTIFGGPPISFSAIVSVYTISISIDTSGVCRLKARCRNLRFLRFFWSYNLRVVSVINDCETNTLFGDFTLSVWDIFNSYLLYN